MDPELKNFFVGIIDQLRADIARLTQTVDRQNSMIRDIEIKSTTRVAELQVNLDNIKDDIRKLETEQRGLGDSQKFKWKTLAEERALEIRLQAEREAEEAKEAAEREKRQEVINGKFSIFEKFLYAIFTVCLGILITFIWTLIVNGGVKGLIP